MSNLSAIFMIVTLLSYIITWLLDLPTLKKATGREKAIYYVMAVSVFGLYLCSLFEIDVPMPTRWVVYTWSDWLHGILTT